MSVASLERARESLNGRSSNAPELYPTTWETIDPELATLYLESNDDNPRHKDRRTITAYANAMLRGEWKTNGDAIRFDINGNLINGQHTLYAIVESGVAQVCLVVRGLPPEVAKTIDRQRRRNDAHDLGKAGFTQAYLLAATIRLLWSYETYRSTQSPPEQRLTIDQLEQIARAIPSLQECVSESGSKQQRVLIPSHSAALWFATRGMPEKRRDFFDILRGDTAATRKSPPFLLRERFSSERGRGAKKTGARDSVALAFKAWNLFYEGREVGCLKMAEGEAFPVLKGYGDELTATFPEWIPQTMRK